MPLIEKIKGVKMDTRGKRSEPLWKGPEVDGVTQGLLGRFLSCRERFRVLVVEGLKPADTFNHRLEYGNMWHICEQAHAAAPQTREPQWQHALADYARKLAQHYRMQGEQVEHWYNVCRTQFPLYVDFWKQHLDVLERTPLLQEQVFDVPYRLPSGRIIRLRGKWDSVDLIGKGKDVGVYLQENKSKGDVNEIQLRRQLASGFDLQTMFYLVALEEWNWDRVVGNGGIKGVRYNVIRRPLSGGKGSIVRHKPTKSNALGESKDAFYGRLRDVIAADPAFFFMRWKVEIGSHDMIRFRRECLDPILENLIDWWDEINPLAPLKGTSNQPRPPNYYTPLNWRHPFGVYNPLDEGGSSDLDEYLATGSEVGLQRTDDLFPELREM